MTPNGKTWNQASTYGVPAGTQVVAVQCASAGMMGGLLASFDNGDVTDASWQCSAESFDSGMAPATAYEANDNTVSGISRDAYWIWTSKRRYSEGQPTVYCKMTLNW